MADGIHVCVGLYPNMSYVVNYVRDDDLADNVEYNRKWRPGRAYFVDGGHVCEDLAKSGFVEKCLKRLSKMKMPAPESPSRIYR